jgi:hypothetical protein
MEEVETGYFDLYCDQVNQRIKFVDAHRGDLIAYEL